MGEPRVRDNENMFNLNAKKVPEKFPREKAFGGKCSNK